MVFPAVMAMKRAKGEPSKSTSGIREKIRRFVIRSIPPLFTIYSLLYVIWYRENKDFRLITFNLHDGHVMVNDIGPLPRLLSNAFLPAIVIDAELTSIPWHLASLEDPGDIHYIIGW